MTDATEHRSGRSGHVVQFYAADGEVVAAAGAALRDTLLAGGFAIVIATQERREAFDAHLREHGVDVGDARDQGRLIALDAAETLARIMRGGAIDREAFEESVGVVVRHATATGRPVQAFGEMVALLWQAGDVMAAIALEERWHDLVAETACSVHCAYPSHAMAGAEHASAVERVCRLHSAVVAAEPLEASWRFDPEPASASEARRRLTDALERQGHDAALLADARLVVTELAANAIRHARSSFTVTVTVAPPSVRIEVADAEPGTPSMRESEPTATSGRGLRLVAAVARRWGVRTLPQGKAVWAELML